MHSELMFRLINKQFFAALALAIGWTCLLPAAVPVVTLTNFNLRIAAANLTTGSQTYEAPALRIFQALRPDIVAIQEFKYTSTNGAGVNTTAARREMINASFGTNFSFFCETNPTGGAYNIPNGIISRWPILAAGTWKDADVNINDRGFAWARIDLPGTNDLYVVSIHLKASNTSTDPTRRAAQAAQLKSLIQSNFPANAFLIVAGDCNIYDTSEVALATLKSFLSDNPAPADGTGNTNTNAGRAERYDYVFPSPELNTNRAFTVVGSQAFASGLVFDTRRFAPTNDMLPALPNDSGATAMQHMAVVKDFSLSYTLTNFVTVPSPALLLVNPNVVRWQGVSNLSYTVLTSSGLPNWVAAGTVTSPTTNFFFTNSQPAANRRFYRVVYP